MTSCTSCNSYNGRAWLCLRNLSRLPHAVACSPERQTVMESWSQGAENFTEAAVSPPPPPGCPRKVASIFSGIEDKREMASEACFHCCSVPIPPIPAYSCGSEGYVCSHTCCNTSALLGFEWEPALEFEFGASLKGACTGMFGPREMRNWGGEKVSYKLIRTARANQ